MNVTLRNKTHLLRLMRSNTRVTQFCLLKANRKLLLSESVSDYSCRGVKLRCVTLRLNTVSHSNVFHVTKIGNCSI